MANDNHERDLPDTPGNEELKSRFRTIVHLAATIAGLYVCYLMAQPFFPAFAWALTLAILFYPLYLKMEKRWKSQGIAALVTVLIAAAIVSIPMVLLTERLITEANKAVAIVKTVTESDEWLHTLLSHPSLAPFGRLIEEHLDIQGVIGGAASWLTNLGASFVKISTVKIVLFLITFYMLFYFLRDRTIVLRSLRDLSPLSAREMSRFFVLAADTVHATFYGTVVVAAIQGALGGLMFWWLGLPAPLLWGVIMGMLAVVPVLGAFVIWIPAALYLALDGRWVSSLVLVSWGTVVVGGIDNLIYPILVGNRLKLHTLPAFISIVGGLLVFGASGIILGPLALTATLFLLEIWHSRVSASPP